VRRSHVHLAVVALVITLAWPAIRADGATQLTPPRLIVSVSPSQVSYSDPTFTISGTLETAGQTPQPLPGEPVQLSFSWEGFSTSESLGSVTTDASGDFSVTAQAPAPGVFHASFAGDTSYGAVGAAITVSSTGPLPIQIAVQSGTGPYDTTVQATVQVTMQLPDGSWVPAPYSPITANGCSGPDAGKLGWTDSSGDLTLQLTNDPDGRCDLYSYGSTEGSWTGYGSAPVPFTLTTFPSEISSFYPVTVVNDDGQVPVNDIDLAGVAMHEDATGTEGSYPGAMIDLYFQAHGSTTWNLVATAQAGPSGWFQFPTVPGYLPGGHLAVGLWKAEIPAAPPYLSGSDEMVLVLSVPTWMRRVHPTSFRNGYSLSGNLNYLPHGGPLHGVRVALRVRPEDSSRAHWRRVRTVVTNDNGRFTFLLPRVAAHGEPMTYQVTYRGGPLPVWAGGPSAGTLQSSWTAEYMVWNGGISKLG
jgi:hypothetical protein